MRGFVGGAPRGRNWLAVDGEVTSVLVRQVFGPWLDGDVPGYFRIRCDDDWDGACRVNTVHCGPMAGTSLDMALEFWAVERGATMAEVSAAVAATIHRSRAGG